MMQRGIFLAFLFAVSPVDAGDLETIIEGGRLYDKWWVDTKLTPPDRTHSAYTEGKQSGSATWRCKECHGWDYRGKDGAYMKGSHYSGIKGIRGAAGRPIDLIVQVLSDVQHGFDKYLGAEDLTAVARFVSEGQIDMTKFISYDTKRVSGDTKAGKKYYKKHCLDCHGKSGDSLNLAHTSKKPEYVGTISNKNPWETLHKIRFGHPGAVMDMRRMHDSKSGRHHRVMRKMWEHMPPMLGVLSDQAQVDLLSYLQTLSD